MANPILIARWNSDFSSRQTRRSNIRRVMRQNLTAHPEGRGNRAWKRADALDREPGTITWPRFAL